MPPVSDPAPHEVPCPQCGRLVEWSEAAPFRPFCSERCRLIDLGEWFDESHAIPGDEGDEGS
ncbi:MAG TPA: DNA gyrase inhibitor YacG [Gammaproteobacteria bacterium]|nr:DNA gyrase inhibitor YacG [Gammaproteobacteria bacterium]